MVRTPAKSHWIVRMHYAMRTLAFGMMFIAISLHLRDKSFSLAGYLLLVLTFVVYPHLQYWRSSRAAEPVKTELRNLLIDNALLGASCAALHFPLWITFSAAIGGLINLAFNEGWRGAGKALPAFAGGALVLALANGFQIAPDTDWAVTLFCIGGLTVYLICMGHIAFRRNLQLRTAREQLRSGERAMGDANQSLRARLAEIDLLQNQLREQANRDPLTGLYNRRYLDSTLDRELSRCKREGLPLALIMIDLDHFKNVNDTYGHQAGDEIPKMLGATLSGFARAEDVACRYGGEEFLLLLPKVSIATAGERAEDLRRHFSEAVLQFGEFRLQTTLSVGIAIYPDHGKSVDELLQSADRALYLAKRGGRNRVEMESCRVGGETGPTNPVAELIWHERFLTGHSEIDRQHQALLATTNSLLSALAAAAPREAVSALVNALLGELKRHFEAEEALLDKTQDPAAAHVADHQRLIVKATALMDQTRAGTADMGEIVDFLTRDLIGEHIIESDRPAFMPRVRASA